MQDRPIAKASGIISEAVEGELVLYDEDTQTAHSLSAAAASVWALCDGQRTAAQIAGHAGLQPELVSAAIEGLHSSGLLERSALLSRREAAKRAAKIGGAAFVAPMIYSVAIGPAIAAASVCTTNVNGTIMPSTAKCLTARGGAVGDDQFGISTGPSHCCSGTCFGDEDNTGAMNYFCPASGCTSSDTTHVTSASDCCNGLTMACGSKNQYLCCT